MNTNEVRVKGVFWNHEGTGMGTNEVCFEPRMNTNWHELGVVVNHEGTGMGTNEVVL